jgi:hypothetical protein
MAVAANSLFELVLWILTVPGLYGPVKIGVTECEFRSRLVMLVAVFEVC